MEWLSMQFVGMVAVFFCLSMAWDCLKDVLGLDEPTDPNTY